MSSSFGLRWTQTISEVPTPFWGPFSIFLWRPFLVALSFGAPSSSFVCPVFFFMSVRALFLGYEGSPLIYFMLLRAPRPCLLGDFWRWKTSSLSTEPLSQQ